MFDHTATYSKIDSNKKTAPYITTPSMNLYEKSEYLDHQIITKQENITKHKITLAEKIKELKSEVSSQEKHLLELKMQLLHLSQKLEEYNAALTKSVIYDQPLNFSPTI